MSELSSFKPRWQRLPCLVLLHLLTVSRRDWWDGKIMAKRGLSLLCEQQTKVSVESINPLWISPNLTRMRHSPRFHSNAEMRQFPFSFLDVLAFFFPLFGSFCWFTLNQMQMHIKWVSTREICTSNYNNLKPINVFRILQPRWSPESLIFQEFFSSCDWSFSHSFSPYLTGRATPPPHALEPLMIS